jgi:hypothetical protein
VRVVAFKSLALAIATAAFPLGIHAQAAPVRDADQAVTGSSADAVRRNLLLVNPFGVVFNVFNGEYERVTSKNTSIGLSGTYYAPRDYTYFTTEIKARYYPSEHAPDGFSVALSGGVTHVTSDGTMCWDVCTETTTNRPTLGFELDYNWVLGPARHFTVGAGIGAKRFLGSNTDNSIDGLPTARLALGVAF